MFLSLLELTGSEEHGIPKNQEFTEILLSLLELTGPEEQLSIPKIQEFTEVLDAHFPAGINRL